MRPVLPPLFLAFLLCLAPTLASFAQGSKGVIFRDVRVGKRMAIALGTPFTADKLATKIDTYKYELNKGAFTGAERIEVMVTDNGLVQTLIFVYPQGVTVRRVIDSYRTPLGEPETIDPSGTERGFFWSDGLTRFEVLQPNADSGPVISRLINQAVTVPPK